MTRTFNQQLRLPSLSLVVCCLAGALHAADSGNEQDEPRADKSGYNLFNPTPRKEMREMSTDRPDKTESAYTVDAGHFQFEMDVLSYAHDRDTSGGSDTRIDAFAIAPINLKLGILNDVDLQLVLQTYNYVRVEDRTTGAVEKQSGFGDVIPRIKVNLWGNDGGPTAFAMMPFLKIPSNQDNLGNNAVEGGIIFPFSSQLVWGWGLGMIAQFDFRRNEADRGYHAAFVNTIAFGHNIHGKLDGYVEFFSEVLTESGSRWEATVDLGLTYALTEDIQLDTGINIGVTSAAADLNPFVGISWRF